MIRKALVLGSLLLNFQWGDATLRARFTQEEDLFIQDKKTENPDMSFEEIASHLPGRSARQCRERWSFYLNAALRMPFTPKDNQRLRDAVMNLGTSWKKIALLFPGKTESQCKYHWNKHLRPASYKSTHRLTPHRFTPDEDQCILDGRAESWSFKVIASRLPGRTETQCSSRWTILKRTAKPPLVDVPAPDDGQDVPALDAWQTEILRYWGNDWHGAPKPEPDSRLDWPL
ncbi:MAG: hypothetical protein LBR89_01750 [Holosporales bacterium]|jgi:hypothetical protein|nr:hypothetical protein [Holosporales bacterium]